MGMTMGLPLRRRLDRPAAVAAIAVAVGVAVACRRAWVCDDAFISFRYADNLVDGLGLVFNAGERVEGYTNLLWTLFIALGLRLGSDPEVWAVVWGLLFWAGTLILLAMATRRNDADGRPTLPLAAMAAAVHLELATFATGGLETPLFTFLVLAGFVLLRDAVTTRRAVQAGLVVGLAALTRPDGAVFFVVGLPYLVWVARPALHRVAGFAGAFASLWIPMTLWRLSYYGDWLPNTYYAKSADLAWWSQGFTYLGLYFAKYWMLLLAFPALGLLAWRARATTGGAEPCRRSFREASLALGMAGAYGVLVARVGGDFMFARLLLPVTPLLLVVIEEALRSTAVRRPRVGVAAAVALTLAVATARSPFSRPGQFISGIADEWDYYNRFAPDWGAWSHHRAMVLQRMFRGLGVRVAFLAAEARMVYYARFPVAVECETGLTDRVVARQPLSSRHRVGHEKKAPVPYILEQRKLHFIRPSEANSPDLPLDDYIPELRVRFGPGVVARALWWDAPLMTELVRRGALVPDPRIMIDADLRALRGGPKQEVARRYARWRRFYFDHVNDAARAAAFEALLHHAR